MYSCTDRLEVTSGQNSEKPKCPVLVWHLGKGLLCAKEREDPRSRSLGVPGQMLQVRLQSHWECVANWALTASLPLKDSSEVCPI